MNSSLPHEVARTKKVLVIAYLYPPIFNSGTRRSLEFVNHLPDCGWEPTVLTVADPDPSHCDPSLLDEVRPGTRIERAPRWSKHVGSTMGRLFGRWFGRERIEAALAWRIEGLWSVPDGVACWAPLAVKRAIELHREIGFDAIYASGWPWTSFLVAEKVSRRTGVPFVVDYRDLWKPADVAWDKASRAQRVLNPMLERRVLKRASGVIATTRSFLDLLPKGDLPEKVFAITNGFSERDFEHVAAASRATGEKVRIVYTGVWRPGYGPDDLYAAVRQLKERGLVDPARLRIVTAGYPPGPARDFGIEDMVEERGRVTHAEALALMSSADALYLPVSKGLYEYASIPGKLFEYMASGRHLLVSALAASEVGSTIEQVGGALRLEPGDVDGLAGAIRSMCEDKAAVLFAPRKPEQLAKFTRANLTRQLAQALLEISGADSAPPLKQAQGIRESGR